MHIDILNPSSPGASFTDSTNSVLLKIYDWIEENKGLSITFREFRKRLELEKNINDNNNRNIFPLLKNGNLVQYQRGETILVDDFYTSTGYAYVKLLKLVELTRQDTTITGDKLIALESKYSSLLQDIIYKALIKIVENKTIGYVVPLQDMVYFLVKFQKINKEEYAYLLYERQNEDILTSLDKIEQNIQKYRANEIQIEASVTVRNDLSIQEETNLKNRKEGVGFLTSYGYFVSLLSQAGLIVKEDKYYVVINHKLNELKKLVEV